MLNRQQALQLLAAYNEVKKEVTVTQKANFVQAFGTEAFKSIEIELDRISQAFDYLTSDEGSRDNWTKNKHPQTIILESNAKLIDMLVDHDLPWLGTLGHFSGAHFAAYNKSTSTLPRQNVDQAELAKIEQHVAQTAAILAQKAVAADSGEAPPPSYEDAICPPPPYVDAPYDAAAAAALPAAPGLFTQAPKRKLLEITGEIADKIYSKASEDPFTKQALQQLEGVKKLQMALDSLKIMTHGIQKMSSNSYSVIIDRENFNKLTLCAEWPKPHELMQKKLR